LSEASGTLGVSHTKWRGAERHGNQLPVPGRVTLGYCKITDRDKARIAWGFKTLKKITCTPYRGWLHSATLIIILWKLFSSEGFHISHKCCIFQLIKFQKCFLPSSSKSSLFYPKTQGIEYTKQ
jgi:hypothetical protein